MRIKTRLSSPGIKELRAFSLVELIVVIGILTLLLAMVFPTLTVVRQQSQSLQCQNNLRNIGIAAQLHTADHHGYLPMAGKQWDLPGPINPENLGDANQQKYLYYTEGRLLRPLPTTAALATAMGANVHTESRAALEADLHSSLIQRYFLCPSQAVERWGWTVLGGSPNWTGPRERSSYDFNEAILGNRGKGIPNSPKGLLVKIRRPEMVLFAMDGCPRDDAQHNHLTIPDTANNPHYTVQSYYEQSLNPSIQWLGREALDFPRHRFRANVLFVDWHVESIPMSRGGLARVGVSDGVY